MFSREGEGLFQRVVLKFLFVLVSQSWRFLVKQCDLVSIGLLLSDLFLFYLEVTIVILGDTEGMGWAMQSQESNLGPYVFQVCSLPLKLSPWL